MGVKRLLIVDDSEIDRTALRNILNRDFDIVEAENGYAALEIILSGRPRIDGMLLDIFMPILDGFNVLTIMKEHQIANLPVVLVTANATKPNVEKAIYYKVTDFISKPFNAEHIRDRFCAMFGVEKQNSVIVPRHTFSDNDIAETNAYVEKLKGIYDVYLANSSADEMRYDRISALTKMLLSEYVSADENCGLDSSHIDMISKAAYFMNIGHMTVPDDYVSHRNNSDAAVAIYREHTVTGADIIKMNSLPACKYFVKVCSDICLHHHERFDGDGYPHGLSGQKIAVYVKVCAAANRFDTLIFKRRDLNDDQYDFVMKEMSDDQGEFDPRVLELFSSCRASIMSFYQKCFLLKD